MVGVRKGGGTCLESKKPMVMGYVLSLMGYVGVACCFGLLGFPSSYITTR